MSQDEQCILGIDPGLKATGYGLIKQKNRQLNCLESGTIQTDPKLPFPKRLMEIYNNITRLIQLWQPDMMAIEESIYAQNVHTALKLGHARGVALLAAANAGIDIFEYSPKKIKVSLTGNGAAHKEQVRFMVTNLLRLKNKPASLDSSDALAAALCHLNQNYRTD